MPKSERHYTVVVLPGNFEFSAPDSLPVLQAAREAGIDLPASCRNGTCRACMCRLQSGKIGYRIPWPGLTAEEKQEGFILPCVAYPETDLEIDAPGAALAARA